MMSESRYWEDVREGEPLPPRTVGPLTTAHVFRWSAAIENWHRIHYDQEFAVRHEKLPGLVVQGSWKQSAMPQFVKDWAGVDGWVWKVGFQHRRMIQVGDTVTIWGTVTGRERAGEFGLVHLELGMKTQEDVETCPGTAVVALPMAGGPPLPYPFRMPEPAGGGAR